MCEALARAKLYILTPAQYTACRQAYLSHLEIARLGHHHAGGVDARGGAELGSLVDKVVDLVKGHCTQDETDEAKEQAGDGNIQGHLKGQSVIYRNRRFGRSQHFVAAF